MNSKSVICILLSIALLNVASAAEEGGVNVEPNVDETIFSEITHTETTTDLEDWEITLTLSDDAIKKHLKEPKQNQNLIQTTRNESKETIDESSMTHDDDSRKDLLENSDNNIHSICHNHSNKFKSKKGFNGCVTKDLKLGKMKAHKKDLHENAKNLQARLIQELTMKKLNVFLKIILF